MSSTLLNKVLLSAAAVGLGASVAGIGTFATFTGTASSSSTLASGTVSISLPAVGSTNRLATGATGLVPGDSLQRTVSITNSGSEDLASITLDVAATSSSLLDTDATDGLQVAIDACSVAWTESGPPYTYTCGGTSSSVLATTGAILSSQGLGSLDALTSGSTSNLRLTFSLPATAGNTFQGLSTDLSYTFTGTQRAGTNK